jgi:hypothetical protein
MRSTRRTLAALTGGLLLAAPAAPALAEGNPPTRTPFEITVEPYFDELLTGECGFTVNSGFHLTGMEFWFDFEDGTPSGLGYMETSRNEVTFTANGKTLTFLESGHKVARFRDDGTVTFTISGRGILDGIGRRVLTYNAETGELLSVEYVGQSVDLAYFCAALAP